MAVALAALYPAVHGVVQQALGDVMYDRLLMRQLYVLAPARAHAVHQGHQHRDASADAADRVAVGIGLEDRRAVGEAGQARDARQRLYRVPESDVVSPRPGATETGH